jgi:hypothetical protein
MTHTHCSVILTIAIYCSIHDKMENIMNAVEIFILIVTAAKLVLIVVIPTGSMGKINKMNNLMCKVLVKNKTQKATKKVKIFNTTSVVVVVVIYLFKAKALALQMFHDNIQISAKGFFVVDLRLVFSVNW